MLDFNHNATKPPSSSAELTKRINAAIDHALEEAQAKQKARDYLGASLIGEECLRKIQYSQQGLDTFSGQTLRIFAAGHAFEDITANELQQAGFQLKTQKRGEQFGFKVAGGRIGGHIDGVLIGGPTVMKYPSLWEHKALGVKSWNDVVKKGVTVSKPVYAAQIALYQTYMHLADHPALFTARNRDTQELYHELVSFDAALAQKTSDKAVRIIRAAETGELLPRVAQSKDFWLCRWCSHKERCWKAR
jgi:hypothetical protein